MKTASPNFAKLITILQGTNHYVHRNAPLTCRKGIPMPAIRAANIPMPVIPMPVLAPKARPPAFSLRNLALSARLKQSLIAAIS